MRFEFFTGTFWGILLIIVGILFFVRSIFNLQIPVFKIVAGFLLIYWGLSMMFGTGTIRSDKSIIFSQGKFNVQSKTESEYNVIFGDGVIDLTGIELKEVTRIEINTIFGSSKLLIKSGTPIVFEGNTVFGTTSTPEGNTNALGESNYVSGELSDLTPYLKIKNNVIFGTSRLEVVEAAPAQEETLKEVE